MDWRRVEHAFPARSFKATHPRSNNSGAALAAALLAGNRNALFQHIHGDVGLLPGHDERRRDANAVRPASQKEHAALEGELYDGIAFRGALRLGFLVGDDLDSDRSEEH